MRHRERKRKYLLLIRNITGKIIFRILKFIFKKLLFCFFWILPKNKRIWIFGSRDGLYYNENSKALFEYVAQCSESIRPIWITKHKRIHNYLKSVGLEVYKSRSIKGYFFSAIAGATIVSVCLRDVNRLASGRTKVIQLWHGTPLMQNDIGDIGENYDLVTIASEEFKHEQKLSMNKDFQYILTGYPRSDVLFSRDKDEKIEKLLSDYGCKKMVLYLPTHRQRLRKDGRIQMSSFNMFKHYGLDIEALEKVLKKKQSLFVVKLHPVEHFDDNMILNRINESKCLHLVDPCDPLSDVYDYLRYTDILITDYSSVYFDFLLTNRSIIFAPFDYEERMTYRKLRFPYEEVTPGPKVDSWGELLNVLDKILSGRDDWAGLRETVNRRFNAYRDGRSSERVYYAIRNILGLKGNGR